MSRSADARNRTYAAALRNRHADAHAWITGAIDAMIAALETDPDEIGLYPDSTTIPLNDGARLEIRVVFYGPGRDE